MGIRPLSDKVVVKMLDSEETTKSGIVECRARINYVFKCRKSYCSYRNLCFGRGMADLQ